MYMSRHGFLYSIPQFFYGPFFLRKDAPVSLPIHRKDTTMRGKKPDFDCNPLAVILILLAICYLLPPILFGISYALAEWLSLC